MNIFSYAFKRSDKDKSTKTKKAVNASTAAQEVIDGPKEVAAPKKRRKRI